MNRRMRWTLRVGCGCGGLLAIGGLLAVCAGLAVPAGVRGAAVWREQVDRVEGAPAGRFVQAGDVEVFVLERGPADGPVVVFVHGSGAWSGTWEPMLDGLAANGVRTVAIDLPPFGYSARPTDYSRPAQAQRILAAVDALGVERFTLVGHSFGGGPTVDAALRAPDRLDGLVLISAALSIGAGDLSLASQGMLVRPVREVGVAATFTNPSFTPTGLRSFVHDPAAITPAVIARYRRPLDVRGSTSAVADWLPELVAPSDAPSLHPRSYEGLAVRTLLIWGAEDHATPVAQAEALAGWLPDAQLVVLPGVGHLPQIEAHDAVLANLRTFLGQTADDGDPAPHGL